MAALCVYSLMAVGYLLLFFLTGMVLPKKCLSGSVTLTCISGFLIYYAVFQVIAFPMKYLRISLSTLMWTWLVLIGMMIVFVVIFRRDYISECMKKMLQAPVSHKLLWGLTTVITLILAVVLGSNTNVLSDMDALYAIGTPVSTAYSNTLELMSPYTGNIKDSVEVFYILNTDMIQSALFSKVMHISPLVERMWCFTIAMVCMFEMALYHVTEVIMGEEKEKQGMFWILANLVLFFSFHYSGVSAYMTYRTYEGKSVFGYFYSLAIFLMCLLIYHEQNRKYAWTSLFFCSMGAVAFTNSALFLAPLMTGMTLSVKLLSDAIHKKGFKNWLYLIIVLIPDLFWMIIHSRM